MKRLFTLFVALFICNIQMIRATDVTGVISSNTSWTLAGSPYIVTGNITINPGVTLTIDSSVVVKFNNSRNMVVNGTLSARYASFTSSAASPTPGIWDYIQFGSSSYHGFGDVKNCSFYYGNQLFVMNGTVSMEGCILDNFYSYGIQCSDTLNLKDTYINMPSYNTSYGIAISALANGYITANNLDVGNCRIGFNVNANANFITSNGSSIIGADQYGAYVLGQMNLVNTSIDLTGYTSTGHGIEATTGALISLDNCSVTHSNYALHIYSGSSTSISNSSFTTNVWPGYYEGTGVVTTSGANNFTGNTRNAFYVNFTTLSTSWTLPTINVPYYFYSDFTVNQGATLSILSGNTLKIKLYNGIYVNGTLAANSDIGTNIYFTSERDDNWGGDTNNDGATTSPATNDWYGITFNDNSLDAACVLRRCKIRYAGFNNGGSINTINASPTIDYCDLSNSYYGIKMLMASNPVFTNNTIGSSQMTPIAMSFEANPLFASNTLSFSDNAYDAIGLLGGTMTTNAVVSVRSFPGAQNITYLMLDNITVPQGLTLTINKGVVIKTYYPTQSYYNYRKFIVEGRLNAIGTADSMIVFTSARDDNFGNPFDTNKDGSQTSPSIGDWGGFLFTTTSDTASKLSFCRIYYGDNNDYKQYSSSNTYQGGQITLLNASPTIQNCIIKHNEYGVYCVGASYPKIWNTSFDNSTIVPIAQSICASPVFSGNTMVNPSYYAIGIIGEDLGVSGTLHRQNFAGYNNITYMLLDNLFINSGTYVSIDSGVVIKANTSKRIEVNGGLKVIGGTLSGNKIAFTSLKDDNEGNPGDTNNDGSTTSPSGGDWGRIQFNDISDDLFCQLKNFKIKYGGLESGVYKGCLAFISANTIAENGVILGSSNYGIWSDGASEPSIDLLAIQNCNNDPIAMSLKSDPLLTNISFSNNGSNGIRIIEGTLSSNAILKQRSVAGFENIAYIVQQLSINENAILTIEPGVIIKFQTYDGYYDYNLKGFIIVNGGFSAIGTVSEPIIFTSLRDDSKGGDTNNDGNTTTPQKADWRYVEINNSGLSQNNKLKNCIVSYGGGYSPNMYDYEQFYFKRCALVCVNNASLEIDSCVFEHSGTSGIGIYGTASPSLSNSEFSNLALTPVIMSLFSDPVFGNNITVSNVGLWGLGLAVENFSNNDTVQKRNFAGFNNMTYILFNSAWSSYYNSSINSGTTIFIPEGIIFKYVNYTGSLNNNCRSIDISGGLQIIGTPTEPVIFTDFRDDSYGNPMDTNGDGSLTTPTINSQYILNFNSISDDANCKISNAIFKYQNNAIQIQQSSPTIKNTLFEENNWGINMNGVSEPIIDSCVFNNLKYTPIEFSLVSYPSSTNGNSIIGSTYKALGIKAETMSQDVIIPKRTFGGLTNIPYYFHDNFTIGTSSLMTIEPGVVLKFNDYKSLTVKKGLMAIGGSTADSTIVFTDIRDDFYGGDSNGDGSATQTGFNYISWNNYLYPWMGIIFENESSDALCRLDHCVIRSAGYNGNGYVSNFSGLKMNSASPTIINSSICKNQTGIQANGSSNPLISNCDIFGNQVFGVQNSGLAFNINAENCWWGSNTGPTHSGNPGGVGDAVTNMVDYTPWRTNGASVPFMGDVSLNGIVQAYDASLVLQHAVGSITLNSTQQQVADVSAAAGITAYDASLILQYVVGLIQYFPAELLKSSASVLIDPILHIGSGSVAAGETIELPIMLQNSDGMMAADIKLNYDPIYLMVEQVDNLVAGMTYSFQNDSANGVLSIALAGTEPLTGDVSLINVTFRASLSAGNVTTPVTILNFTANESDLTTSAIPGSIIIGEGSTEIDESDSFKGVLSHIYPNPSHGNALVNLQLPSDDLHVTVEVFNMMGQKINTPLDETLNHGNYTIMVSDQSKALNCGSYLVRVAVDGITKTQILQVIK